MSRRCFNQPSLADAFVKAYSRSGGFLEEIAKTFDWPAFDVILPPLHSSCEGAPAYRKRPIRAALRLWRLGCKFASLPTSLCTSSAG